MAGRFALQSMSVVIAAIALATTPAKSREVAKAPPPDCGVNALFVLLRLEGRPVELGPIESALGPPHPDGASMAELASASRTLGLPLDGVRFNRRDAPLDRPAIAYFNDGAAGHFAVLRPVGTTGTMVQVIDPPKVPRIVDYDRLFTNTPWTGRILVRRDPWIRRAAWPIVGAVGLTLVAASVAPRLIRSGSTS